MSLKRMQTWGCVWAVAIGLLCCVAVHRVHGQSPWLQEEESVSASQAFQPPDVGSVVEYRSDLLEGPPPLQSQRLSLLTAAERAPFRLLTTFAPSELVHGTNESLSVRSLAAQLAFPLRIYPNGILLGTSTINHTRLGTGAVLPQSGTEVPNELWDVRAGMFLTRELASGWKVGGMFNFGSASDEPFHSEDELTLASLGFVSVPTHNRDAWTFSLFYSPTSQLNFPIPGIAYVWRPNDELEAQIGLPASLIYAPNDSFSFRARYTPVTDVLVEARRGLGADWSLFTRYQIINETYFLAERSNREDRFFQFEQQIAVGISRSLPAGFSLDLSAAYLWDRRFFHSSDFDLRSDDLIKIDPTVSYSLQLIWNR